MEMPQIRIDAAEFEHLFGVTQSERQRFLGVTKPSYFSGRILGCLLDEAQYWNLLHEYSVQPQWRVWHQFQLPKPTTTPQLVEDVQTILQTTTTLESTVIQLLGQNILPLPPNPAWHEHYFTAYCHSLAPVLQPTFNPQAALELICSLVSLQTDIQEMEISWPRYVWYGPMTQTSASLLAFLMLIHADVLIFSPMFDDELKQYFPQADTWSSVCRLPIEVSIQPFPTKRREVVATPAHQAASQLQQVLSEQVTSLYRPWQLRTYQLQSLQLQTTSEEWLRYCQQPAMMRPGFLVTKTSVNVPVLFAKINGVDSVSAFSELVDTLRALPNTIILEQFPFMPKIVANYSRYLHALKSPSGEFLPERFLQAPWWRYQSLSIALQKQLITAMIRTLQDQELRLVDSMLEQQALILGVLIDLPDPFVLQLENYDYAREIPKVISINSQSSGDMSCEDASVFRFLNHLGYDIISLNPSSRSDMERYLSQNCIQIHQLPAHWFEYPKPQPLKKTRFWQRK